MLFRRPIGSLVLLLIGASLPAFVATPAQAAPDRLRVISHNIEGGNLHQGNAKALDPVIAQIAIFNPHGVMLQEVCESQLSAFRARFPTWQVAYNPRRVNSACGAGAYIGELVASPIATAVYPAQPIADDADSTHASWTYALSCLDIQTTHAPARLCSTHLAGGDAPAEVSARKDQVRDVAAHSSLPIAAGMATIVAGDFNSQPGEAPLDPMYQINRATGEANGAGQFWESDQGDRSVWTQACKNANRSYCRTGKPTFFAQKKDYIFISRNTTQAADLKPANGGATVIQLDPKTQSDHHLLKAAFDVYE